MHPLVKLCHKEVCMFHIPKTMGTVCLDFT